jgi:pseudouridine-5'-phosphate glycosidase/pseudouridine kinase
MLALLRKRLIHASQNGVRSINTAPKNTNIFRISEEIREALHSNKPVVALETTIYTHGFPYPENLALASYLESVVRENGGVPATIGILDGVARVGLSLEEIIQLCSSKGPTTLKLSRRDLAYATASSLAGSSRLLHGGTTIAGTMILAQKAGIKVFATGGLGGVHRGGEGSLDISADLTELGRTPVAVIASGCKGFLDIPRTLEYLETQGVGVATFADGRDITKKIDFPAFWARDSGSKSPMIIENEAHAAAIICKHSGIERTTN